MNNSSGTTSNFDFSSINLSSYLPDIFQSNPFYTDYLDGVTSVWQESVFPYMKAISNLRQGIDEDTRIPQEIYVLVRNASLLGYKFISNFMNQQDYLKLVEFIARYHEVAGTKQLANFLGYVKGAKVSIEQLWSQIGIEDYTAFYYKYQIDETNTVISNPGQTTPGTWYPTSHKRISYDLLLMGTVTGDLLNDFESTVRELFYTLAPIHWVLDTIVASVYLQLDAMRLGVMGYQSTSETFVTNLEIQPLQVSGESLTFEGEVLSSTFKV